MDTFPPTSVTSDRLFAGASTAEAILRGIDWRQHPLGPPSGWPISLRTALRICLTSRHAMILWWGDDLTVFYNDAYAPTLSTRHPRAMGQPGQAVWPEIWDVIGPMLRGVLGTRVKPRGPMISSSSSNAMATPEETYHSFSYSPIEGEDGLVGGVFTAVTETTQRVLAERRAALARDLAGALVDAHTTEEVAQRGHDRPSCQPFRRADDRCSFGWKSRWSRAHLLGQCWHRCRLGHCHPCAMVTRRAVGAGRRCARPRASRRWSPWGVAALHGARCGLGTGDRRWCCPSLEPGQARNPRWYGWWGISPPSRVRCTDYRALFDLLASHVSGGPCVAAHAYEAERARAEAVWPNWIKQKRSFLATSATNFARRSPCCWGRLPTAWPIRPIRSPPAAAGTACAGPAQRPTAAKTGQYAARLFAHRGGAHARRPLCRPISRQFTR